MDSNLQAGHPRVGQRILSTVNYGLINKAYTSASQYICFLAGYAKKTTQTMFKQFGENVAHESRKKPLNFGGNEYLYSP